MVHLCVNHSVPVELVAGKDVPTAPHCKDIPCHKKNPSLGNKQVYYSNKFFIEQEDARTFKQDEEVPAPIILINLGHLDGLGKCDNTRNHN